MDREDIDTTDSKETPIELFLNDYIEQLVELKREAKSSFEDCCREIPLSEPEDHFLDIGGK